MPNTQQGTNLYHQRSWKSGEVLPDWKLAKVIPIFKKGIREDPGNYRPDSLTSVSEKIMEKIILDIIENRINDKAIIKLNQHRFMIFYDIKSPTWWMKGINRLEHWAISNSMKFNKGKCQVLHQVCSNIKHTYRLRDEGQLTWLCWLTVSST